MIVSKAITLCVYIASTFGGSDAQRQSRYDLCLNVAEQAEQADLDVTFVLALAIEESRMTSDVKSVAGAVGPLQVIKKWYCKHECDPVEAGIRAIKTWKKLYPKKVDMLCHYNSGFSQGHSDCPERSKLFARRVLKWQKKLKKVQGKK